MNYLQYYLEQRQYSLKIYKFILRANSTDISMLFDIETELLKPFVNKQCSQSPNPKLADLNVEFTEQQRFFFAFMCIKFIIYSVILFSINIQNLAEIRNSGDHSTDYRYSFSIITFFIAPRLDRSVSILRPLFEIMTRNNLRC